MVNLFRELELGGCALPEYCTLDEQERLEVMRALDHRYLTFTHRKYSPQKINEVEKK